MFPRSLMGAGFDCGYHHLGDLDYWLDILRSGSYLYIPEILCNFRHHRQSATHKNLRELYFVSDYLRLGEKQAYWLEMTGESPEQYRERVILFAATHINKLVSQDDLSLSQVIGDRENQEKELIELKEIAYSALLQVSRLTQEKNSRDSLLLAEERRFDHLMPALLDISNWSPTKPIRGLRTALKAARRLLVP